VNKAADSQLIIVIITFPTIQVRKTKKKRPVPDMEAECTEVSLVRDFKGKLLRFKQDTELKNDLFAAKQSGDEKKIAKLQKKVEKVVAQRSKQKGGDAGMEDKDVLR
jgi:hypothetical protein